jgi:hypothetical protein
MQKKIFSIFLFLFNQQNERKSTRCLVFLFFIQRNYRTFFPSRPTDRCFSVSVSLKIILVAITLFFSFTFAILIMIEEQEQEEQQEQQQQNGSLQIKHLPWISGSILVNNLEDIYDLDELINQ